MLNLVVLDMQIGSFLGGGASEAPSCDKSLNFEPVTIRVNAAN